MYQRILVGTDGSDTAEKAVDRAVQVAQSSGASLTIMSAGSENRARPIVEASAQRHAAAGVQIATAVVDTDPVTALIDLARDDGHDLVVVGNRGMTGVTRFFKLGAVPNKLSHHIPTNLLVVKTT